MAELSEFSIELVAPPIIEEAELPVI